MPIKKTATPKTTPVATKTEPAVKPTAKPTAKVTPTARAEPIADVGRAFEMVDSRRTSIVRATARRPDDMFVAELTIYNVRVVAGAPPTLARLDASRDAILVVELPPQSFGEQAFLAPTGPEVANGTQAGEFPDSTPPNGKNTAVTAAEAIPTLPSARIRMAGPSRLAFTMPDAVTSVPYTIEALLDACRTWPLRRTLSAAPEPTTRAGLAAPGDLDLLGAVVNTPDFVAAQRGIMSTLRDLATADAEAAIVAAGTRVADQAAAAANASDPTTSTPLVVQLLRTEVDTLGARFAVLKDKPARAVATVAVAYQAAQVLDKLGLATKPGFEYSPNVPIMTALVAPYRPGKDVTAIELPYRLVTSPIGPARWTHRASAVARQGRHELWHTRMTTGSGNVGPDKPGAIRAIWSDDYPREDFSPIVDPPNPFRMPLDAQDRKMLVQLTAGFDEMAPVIVGDGRYHPKPARAARVVLSPLGGLLDADGDWSTRPLDVDLQQWRHLTSVGRDHYVRVVYAGYLLPFGHAASLIKVTERKFEDSTAAKGSKRIAVLRQRFYLVVREPVKTFDGSYHVTGGHPFPFTSIELLTRVTPNLVAPDDATCRVIENGRTLYGGGSGVSGGLTRRQAFWPMLSPTTAGDVRFDVAATDRDGRRTTFALPLLFISEVANTGTVTKGAVMRRQILNVIDGYNDEGTIRRQATLGGASICYAPPDTNGEGDPRMPTESMLFRGGQVKVLSTDRINTYPETEEARVAMRAVQRILGRDDAMVNVVYPEPYRSQGFGGGNPGEVFLALKNNGSWDLAFGPNASASRSDAVGAVASPSMSIKGMSRRIGPAADLGQVTSNTFDPVTFFGDARILGGIRLADVVPKVTTGLGGASVPKLLTRELPASGNLPARTEARYEWRTQLATSDPANLLLPKADGVNASPFDMLAVTTVATGSSDATAMTSATMGNFKVNLFGFIVLWFRELRFASERGRKPDVTVDFHPAHGVEFGGPLEFVNQLRKLIPGSGFSDPPSLTVTPSGISASYGLTIPSVQVGVFALSGLSFGARFSLPFDTRPVEVAFNFSERQNPFSLTVSLLGGGGFLVIGIGADGVREIEAALEAGARLSIDLGVASGSVEIKAGVYFHWITDAGGGGLVELSGYVRLHGELDVMGLISASLTFNLQLTYTKEGHRSVIWGEATLTIEIEVLLFSGEVTVRCRREFGGSEADPTFAQLVPGGATWSSYCSAFAQE